MELIQSRIDSCLQFLIVLLHSNSHPDCILYGTDRLQILISALLQIVAAG